MHAAEHINNHAVLW